MLHPHPRPLSSELQDSLLYQNRPEQSQDSLGNGTFVASDWRRAYYTYQSPPEYPDLIDPNTGMAQYNISEITGTLPDDLVGDLYRNGPGNFGFHNDRVQHTLDADGLILRISFPPLSTDANHKQRNVTFQSRLVETEALQKERAAGQFLYRGTFGTARRGFPDDNETFKKRGINEDPTPIPFVSRILGNAFQTNIKNTANTQVVSFGGKLLALFEAGLPYALDPLTLETMGEDDMGGVLTKGKLAVKLDDRFLPDNVAPSFLGGTAHTAHPKRCPRTRHLVGWHWSSIVPDGSMEITLTEWNDEFFPVASRTYRLPDCSVAPHDMALTEDYAVMLLNNLSINRLPFLLGIQGPAQSMHMDGRGNMTAVILPRPTSSARQLIQEPSFFSVPPGFCIHFSHGYQDRTGHIKAFFSGWPPSDAKDFLGAWGGFCPDFGVIPPTYIWKLELDPSRKECVEMRVAPGAANVCAEHCVVHPEFATRKARNVYAAASNVVGDSSAPTGYVRLCVEDGSREMLAPGERNTEVDAYWFGSRTFTEEPLVVPKENGNPKDERDAYLLGMIYDGVKDRSALAVFDLKRELREGPVCLLWLESSVPRGLHGCFAAAGGGSASVFC